MARDARGRSGRTAARPRSGLEREGGRRRAPAPDRARRNATGRPTLALVHDVTSSSPLDLHAQLGDRYDIVWVVEAADPSLGSWSRLLARLGDVVDRAGRDPGPVAADLRSSGVDGVIAFTDSQLELAARLSSELGLEGNPGPVVERLVDKGVQRRALARAGFRVPGSSCSSPGPPTTRWPTGCRT